MIWKIPLASARIRAPLWRRWLAWLRWRPVAIVTRAPDPLLDTTESIALEVQRYRALLSHAQWALRLRERLDEEQRRALLDLRRAVAAARVQR